MTILVQKYGGSSVGTLERMKHVASKIIQSKKQGHDVIVVVSAMQGETDRLINLASALTKEPNPREYDILVSTGEQASMALLAIALNAQGCQTKSYTGAQIGILTDTLHTKARILDIKTNILYRELEKGYVIIVAGFQGKNEYNDITTLGRGGSDTTAVAIASALKADECQIYTDVDGVYTTDPRMIPEASLITHISFEEMQEMASLGAKILQMRSVELASRHKIPIRVLSTFNNSNPGTLVTHEEQIMQKRLISGVVFSREESIIAIHGIPNKAGIEGCILEQISNNDIEVDMISQNTTDENITDLTFTLNQKDHDKTIKIIQGLKDRLGEFSIKTSTKVAKLSIVGTGVGSHTSVASTMFKTLGMLNINIQMITTSEIKISVIINETELEEGMRAIHEVFELGKLSESKERFFLAT
ncbi:aspartate kinase [Gammaproteobacteria bacterium]|nr:aspartate kinase [Gammaproteobacteria bacterium]